MGCLVAKVGVNRGMTVVVRAYDIAASHGASWLAVRVAIDLAKLSRSSGQAGRSKTIPDVLENRIKVQPHLHILLTPTLTLRYDLGGEWRLDRNGSSARSSPWPGRDPKRAQRLWYRLPLSRRKSNTTESAARMRPDGVPVGALFTSEHHPERRGWPKTPTIQR